MVEMGASGGGSVRPSLETGGGRQTEQGAEPGWRRGFAAQSATMRLHDESGAERGASDEGHLGSEVLHEQRDSVGVRDVAGDDEGEHGHGEDGRGSHRELLLSLAARSVGGEETDDGDETDADGGEDEAEDVEEGTPLESDCELDLGDLDSLVLVDGGVEGSLKKAPLFTGVVVLQDVASVRLQQ